MAPDLCVETVSGCERVISAEGQESRGFREGVEGQAGGLGACSAVVVAEAGALEALGPEGERWLRWKVGDLPLVVLADGPDRESHEPLWSRIQSLCGSGALREREAHRQLQRQHDRVVRELRMAERVQRSMLPRALPRLPGVSFGAGLRACDHLAGDFYNAFRLDRDHVGFYVGDVMGHGAASALLGMYTMQTMRTKKIDGHHYEILAPDESLGLLNEALIAGDFPGDPFVTMLYAVLNVAERRLSFSSAGHPPMLLLREGEEPRRLDASGFVLGMIEASYQTQQCTLEPGDRLVMFSDGIDSVRWEEQGLGAEGLGRMLAVRDGRAAQEVVEDALARAVQEDRALKDDMTVLMVEIEGD